jgi:hypothetical protein
MTRNERRQPTTNVDDRPPGARQARLALCTLAFALLLGPAITASAMPGSTTEAGRLHSDLARMAELANRRLRPPALRLARDLPGDAERLDRLREPASTTQTQVKIALDELRQMTSLTLDPHYLPALVAAGRAYVAVSGQDPLTGTTISPDYLGLERELAGNAARVGSGADDAGKLSAGVKLLTRELIRAKRRASRLAREVRRMRARDPGIPKR